MFVLWETPVYVVESGQPGPTVVIVGGVHGDETAGAVSAMSVTDWQFTLGRVIVIPTASVTALEDGTRMTPTAEGEDEINLNRLFPINGDEQVAHPLAVDIWRLLDNVRPDWVLDLHEGERYFIAEPPELEDKSVGQTIIVLRDTWAEPLAALMVRSVNQTIDSAMKQYVLIGFGRTSRGQLARAAAEHLGARGMIIETVNSDGSVESRVANHQATLREFFRVLGMQ